MSPGISEKLSGVISFCELQSPVRSGQVLGRHSPTKINDSTQEPQGRCTLANKDKRQHTRTTEALHLPAPTPAIVYYVKANNNPGLIFTNAKQADSVHHGRFR